MRMMSFLSHVQKIRILWQNASHPGKQKHYPPKSGGTVLVGRLPCLCQNWALPKKNMFRQSQWEEILLREQIKNDCILTCLGMRASLKQGSVRSSLRNHFLQRLTMSGWCSTSSSNALAVTYQTTVSPYLWYGHICMWGSLFGSRYLQFAAKI